MKIKSSILLSLIALFLFSACQEKEEDSFILFRDDNLNEILTDTILVDLNSTYDLYLKVSFIGSKPSYYKAFNTFGKELLGDEVRITKDAFDQPFYQESNIVLDFSEDGFSIGDVLMIIVESNSEQGRIRDELVFEVR